MMSPIGRPFLNVKDVPKKEICFWLLASSTPTQFKQGNSDDFINEFR